MAITLKLNDQQEENLFEHFKEIFISSDNQDDDLKLFDLLHSLNLNKFIKTMLDCCDQDEGIMFINYCKERYDL